MSEPNPCEALKCALREKLIVECVEMACPHRWQREAREDRVKREEKDARRGSVPESVHSPGASR